MTFDPVMFSFFGILVAVAIPVILWLRKESKRSGSFQEWLNILNLVAFRGFVAVWLGVVAVITNLLMDVLNIPANTERIEATYWFIFGFSGITATEWIAKRMTHKSPTDQPPAVEQRTVIERKETITAQPPAQPANPQPITNQPAPLSQQEGA